MEVIPLIVSIDVSKNQLDAHVRGQNETFALARDAAGLAAPIERLRPLTSSAVDLEAPSGFETFVAAGLASAGLRVVVVNPAQVRAFANALGTRAKTDPMTPAASRISSRRPRLKFGRCATKRPASSAISSPSGNAKGSRPRASGKASPGCSKPRNANSTVSTATSTTRPKARRSGGRRKTYSPPCRESVRPSPAPSSPRCRNSGHSIAARSLLWSGSRPGPANPANGVEKASSSAAEPKLVALIARTRKLLVIPNAISGTISRSTPRQQHLAPAFLVVR